MSKKKPTEFIPVSASVIKRLSQSVRSALDDASCLGCWIDSEEYEVSNYISKLAYFSFRGFTDSLIDSLKTMNEICKCLDLSLDL